MTAKSAPVTLSALPRGAGEALGAAVDWFLAERDLAPSSRRVYAMALARLTDHLGPPCCPRSPPGAWPGSWTAATRIWLQRHGTG